MFAGSPVVRCGLLALVVSLAAGCGSVAAPRSGNDTDANPKPVPDSPKPPNGGSDPQSLEQIARQYEELQAQADQTNRQMIATLSQYQRRGGKLPPNFGADLSAEQRDLLAFLILNERAETRDLLQDILDKDAQIRGLRVQMQSMRGRLPDHTVAKDGDRHDRLALKYLVDRGVPLEKATELIAQVSLHETLLPGFNVWTYYSDGQFGTWVTKGTASITPQQQQQRVMRELTEGRESALKATADLEQQLETVREEGQKQLESAIEETETAKREVISVAERLEKEKEAALTKAEEAKRQVENTIHYIAGSKKQLERQGVIRGNRVIDASLVPSTSMDVTASTEILLEPAPFELSIVKKVTVLPVMLAQGRDYEIQTEGAGVRFRLLNVELFKRNQFILVVE